MYYYLPESFIDSDRKEGDIESAALLRKVKRRKNATFIFSDDKPLITTTPSRARVTKAHKTPISFSKDFKKGGPATEADITNLKQISQSHFAEWVMYHNLYINRAFTFEGCKWGTCVHLITNLYNNINNKKERSTVKKKLEKHIDKETVENIILAFREVKKVIAEFREEESIKCSTLTAAKKGDKDAQFNLAWMYKGEKNDKEAVKWFQKAAEKGHTDAQFNLAWSYDAGEGIPQDYNMAFKWYQEAAEQGDEVRAQTFLGTMYASGEGAPKNEKKAVEWYTKAADQGFAIAQYFLGIMYEDARGIARNEKKAAELYQKAAAQGYDDAKIALSELKK